MPVGKINDITRAAGQIDVTNHPVFARLTKEDGFEWVDETSFDDFVAAEGFKMAIFAEDPNAKRVTLDIAVIAPELKKAFVGTLSKTVFTTFQKSRALASHYGITGLPAVALFRDNVYLGAVEGLKDWNTYCAELSEIILREKAPARRVSFVKTSSTSSCSD